MSAYQGQIAQGFAKGPKLCLSIAVPVDSDRCCILIYSSANATEILSYISVNTEKSKVWGKEHLDGRCSRYRELGESGGESEERVSKSLQRPEDIPTPAGHCTGHGEERKG